MLKLPIPGEVTIANIWSWKKVQNFSQPGVLGIAVGLQLLMIWMQMKHEPPRCHACPTFGTRLLRPKKSNSSDPLSHGILSHLRRTLFWRASSKCDWRMAICLQRPATTDSCRYWPFHNYHQTGWQGVVRRERNVIRLENTNAMFINIQAKNRRSSHINHYSWHVGLFRPKPIKSVQEFVLPHSRPRISPI